MLSVAALSGLDNVDERRRKVQLRQSFLVYLHRLRQDAHGLSNRLYLRERERLDFVGPVGMRLDEIGLCRF